MATNPSIIPGLSISSVNDEEGVGIGIDTLTGTIKIPESRRFGNCRVISDFEKIRAIPCRSVSQIGYENKLHLCSDKVTQEHRVLKKLQSGNKDGFPKPCVREIGLLKALNQENISHIIHLYGVAVGSFLQSNYLILDSWVCSLEDLIEQNIDGIYNEAVIKVNMQQLLLGISYIHECLILHRNINCENIVFTADGAVKITGFADSRFFHRGDMTPGITDLRYRAPELLLRAKKYTAAVDMWSVGCLLARLVLKDFLFKGSSELEILNEICKVLGTPTDRIWAGFSQLFSGMDEMEKCSLFKEELPYNCMKHVFKDQTLSLQELLEDLLLYNPEGRPSANICLSRSYFTEETRASSNPFDVMKSMLKPFSKA